MCVIISPLFSWSYLELELFSPRIISARRRCSAEVRGRRGAASAARHALRLCTTSQGIGVSVRAKRADGVQRLRRERFVSR